jgi:transcriptional regulator GlxA family with amidase domain
LTYIVGIYLFDDVEVLDFAGPFEVFSTASRVKARLDPESPRPFEVFTLADAKDTVRARGGLIVQPQFDIRQHPPIDVLVIPGGIVTGELQKPNLIEWIMRVDSSTTITASVCTGAFLLGKAGLLDNKSATTHWEDIPDLRAMLPSTKVQTEVRWVDEGKIVTSAGISAGIDMSLHLVARLAGEDLAVRTARQMQFDWEA